MEHGGNDSLLEKSKAEDMKQIHWHMKGRAKKRHSYGSRPMGKGEQEDKAGSPGRVIPELLGVKLFQKSCGLTLGRREPQMALSGRGQPRRLSEGFRITPPSKEAPDLTKPGILYGPD